MQRRKGPKKTRKQRKTQLVSPRIVTASQAFSRNLSLMTVPARETYIVSTVFNDILNNASLVIPYAFAYVDLQTPLKANGGAATVVPFWTMIALRQRKYYVWKTVVTVEFVNQEAFGIDFSITPVNFLPSQTVVLQRALLSNHRAKKRLVSGAGSPNRCTLKSTQTVADFGGFYARGAEDSHVGNTDSSADPTDKLYLNISGDTNGAASVSGVLVSVKVVFFLDAMEPNSPLN